MWICQNCIKEKFYIYFIWGRVEGANLVGAGVAPYDLFEIAIRYFLLWWFNLSFYYWINTLQQRKEDQTHYDCVFIRTFIRHNPIVGLQPDPFKLDLGPTRPGIKGVPNQTDPMRWVNPVFLESEKEMNTWQEGIN